MLTQPCFTCECRICEHVATCTLAKYNAHPCELCRGVKTFRPDGCAQRNELNKVIINPVDVLTAYNRICVDMPKASALTDLRRRHIKARNATLKEFEDIFKTAQASDFLSGRNKKWCNCNLDWLLLPANWQKVKEGVYPPGSPEKKKANAHNDYPQKRYTHDNLSHLFENLGG